MSSPMKMDGQFAGLGLSEQHQSTRHSSKQLMRGVASRKIKVQSFLFTGAMVKSAPETHMAMTLTHPKVSTQQDEVCASDK